MEHADYVEFMAAPASESLPHVARMPSKLAFVLPYLSTCGRLTPGPPIHGRSSWVMAVAAAMSATAARQRNPRGQFAKQPANKSLKRECSASLWCVPWRHIRGLSAPPQRAQGDCSSVRRIP